MSPSCNFPAQAEPSYEDSELSGAELVHFNFWAETEVNWNFFKLIFSPQVLIIRSPVSWFELISWSFTWTFVFF